MSPAIHMMRIHQYVKNLFILAPIFFAGELLNGPLVVSTILAIFGFSLLASSIYVINDYADRFEDAQHPSKKYRSIASGKISPKQALLYGLLFGITGLSIGLFVHSNVFYLMFLYFILNVFYSLKLKHIPIVDISIISSGFVLRLLIGSAATGLPLSMWIILITFILAMFLAIAKRRDDVLLSIVENKEVRKCVDGYNLEFVNTAMAIMGALVTVSYTMYVSSPAVIEQWGTDKLYITVVFVVVGILRYLQLTFVEEKSGSPTSIVLKDRFMQICIFFWSLSYFTVVYLKDYI